MSNTKLFLVLMFGMSGGVSAQQNPCAGDPIVDIYVDVRDNEIPMLDALSVDDRSKISDMYQQIVGVVESKLLPAQDGGAPETLMRNDYNLVNFASEDEIARVVALQVDLTLSMLKAEDREAYVDSLKDAVAALNGESAHTFGQQQDLFNRGIVENSLKSYGCPSDLAEDYGIPSYSP